MVCRDLVTFITNSVQALRLVGWYRRIPPGLRSSRPSQAAAPRLAAQALSATDADKASIVVPAIPSIHFHATGRANRGDSLVAP